MTDEVVARAEAWMAEDDIQLIIETDKELGCG